MGHQQRRHRRLVHADANAVTGDARLRDFERRSADAVAVADADLVVGETLDGEVLAELAVAEIAPSELSLLVAVRVDLVDEHGAVLAAVREPVGLVVPVDVDARTIRGPSTGPFQIAVRTVLPCHSISCGPPT
jgi:hypothetical protein